MPAPEAEAVVIVVEVVALLLCLLGVAVCLQALPSMLRELRR